MALDINQLRAAFSKKSESSGEGNTGFWDKFYPFYKMGYDETVTFRFLPDLDEDNPLTFIVENKYHELMINGKKKRIACLKMYGEACPCCEHSQQHYNAGDIQMGKTFWRKIDYIAQGIIVSTPFEYPIKPDENPVRLISLGPKIYKKLENSIVKGDLDNPPTDMENGYDYRIVKTKQGEYPDYSNSEFVRKSSAISEDILGKIELYDLKKYRYAKIERDQIETMIEAFMTGKSYEDEKDGDASSNDVNTPKETKSATEVLKQFEAAKPAETKTTSTAEGAPKLSPQDILKRLRDRQAAAASS